MKKKIGKVFLELRGKFLILLFLHSQKVFVVLVITLNCSQAPYNILLIQKILQIAYGRTMKDPICSNHNKLRKNIKMLQHHYKLHKIRHIFGFKRRQHTSIHLNSSLLSTLKEQQKVNKTQTFNNSTIYWAIVVFAGFSLFFGIFSFLFNILLLVWQNN
ncbi:unnamed protein product [Meloidogyne enterolobii]|uniref:Uncharacterized protein n=1 Tax=Meloidogyne enterolobii TaxID=390850 RepID=A0ACB0ZYS3_MELEN